jgi:hypothetical protein
MHFISRLIIFSSVLLVLSSCNGRYDQFRSELTVVEPSLAVLNGDRHTPIVGAFYMVEDGQPRLLLDLRDKLSLNESSGWLRRQIYKENITLPIGTARAITISAECVTSRSILCGPRVAAVTMQAHIESVIVDSISDPFRWLELLNRPLTGAPYNRVSEQKIVSWKASLSDALSRARLTSHKKVVLCVSAKRIRSGALTFSQWDLEPRAYEELLSELSSRAGIIAGGEGRASDSPVRSLSFRNTPAISAVYQELRLANVGEEPKIEFGLGPEYIISSSGN